MYRIALLLSLLALVLVSCIPAEDPLVFAAVPADDPAIMRAHWQPIVDYLSGGLDREIELYLVPDYAAQVEAFRAGHVDFGRIGSSSYVIAQRDGVEIEPIASAVKEITNVPGYYSYIIARADSGIETMDDLHGRTFAFVDVQSSSGYVVPMCAIKQAGIELGREFMSGSHEASVLAVQNGTVDAAAVAQIRYYAALEERVIDVDEFRVIWQSALIPNVPIVVQSSMGVELKKELQDLFIDMPIELVRGPSRAGEIKYVEITDAHYDVIREIEAFLNK